ncbi:MAG TPA: outer membrane lipoprotein-sorting protein [Myxococcota bacterium]|nr:outer membrane lipoprotein-sorting protein [Myxococcota bacterium]
MASPRVSLATGLAALCTFVFAGAARAGSIQEVYDCAARNLPPTAHAHAKLTTTVKGGAPHTTLLEYWSQTAPEGARDVKIARKDAKAGEVAAYLVSDGDAIGEAWAYTSGQPKAARIETAGREVKLFDSNLSLEDFARFARVLFPGQVRRLDDADLGGRKAFVVETRPAADGGSEYSRIVTSIDKQWCNVIRRESYETAFEKGEKPRKVYSVDPADVKTDGGFNNPHRARQEDAKDGSTTQMEVLDIELPAKLDDSTFAPDALPRAAR